MTGPEPLNIWGEPTLLTELAVKTLISEGCIVWRRSEVGIPTVGGVVVGVEDDVDHETGEAVRSFRVVESASLREHVIREADVDMGELQPFATASLVRIMRRLAQELYQPPKLRTPVSGPWMPAHSQMVRRLSALDLLVMGR